MGSRGGGEREEGEFSGDSSYKNTTPIISEPSLRHIQFIAGGEGNE